MFIVGSRKRAEVFLKSFLASGPRPSAEVRAAGRAAGFAHATLYRAAQVLALVSEKGVWRLPDPGFAAWLKRFEEAATAEEADAVPFDQPIRDAGAASAPPIAADGPGAPPSEA